MSEGHAREKLLEWAQELCDEPHHRRCSSLTIEPVAPCNCFRATRPEYERANAVLALVSALETAERELWGERGRHLVTVVRAETAERERDKLGNELAQERCKPGGSYDQAAQDQLQFEIERERAENQRLREVLSEITNHPVISEGEFPDDNCDWHCVAEIVAAAREALAETRL